MAVANFDVFLPSDQLFPPAAVAAEALVSPIPVKAIPRIREVDSRIREYSYLDAVEKEFLSNYLRKDKDRSNRADQHHGETE